MPDTGAPWNIPYVAGTDLVRDWPTDSQDLAEAIADGLDAAGNAGIGSNVVQAVKTDTYSQNTSTWDDITDLSVTITPSSASAKILLLASVVASPADTNGIVLFLRFDGGNSDNFVGDADGSREQAWAQTVHSGNNTNGSRVGIPFVGMYLDSPATTSPVTYKVQLRGRDDVSSSALVYVNRTGADTNNAAHGRFASQITAIEVAA